MEFGLPAVHSIGPEAPAASFVIRRCRRHRCSFCPISMPTASISMLRVVKRRHQSRERFLACGWPQREQILGVNLTAFRPPKQPYAVQPRKTGIIVLKLALCRPEPICWAIQRAAGPAGMVALLPVNRG